MENKTKKIISKFLVLVMILVSLPMSVFADEIDKITSVNQEIYKEEVINEDNVIEKTENKTVYELDDGLKREVIYDADVRFYDENNKLTDYDPSLMKIDSSKSDSNEDLSKYKYENKIDYVYVKLEYYNLTGSIKDRMVYYILDKAKNDKILEENMPIIEATSGNTGISIASYGALHNHPVYIFMPDFVSIERKKLMEI